VFTDKTIVWVGRDMTSDVVVDDGAVSSCHALLEHDGESWQISDRDSSNGTYVGAIRLAPRCARVVPARCWMQIGNTELEVFGARPLHPPHGWSPERHEIQLERDREEAPLGVVCVEGGRGISKVLVRQRPYRIGRSRLCEIRGAAELPSEEQVELRVAAVSVAACVTIMNTCEHREIIEVGRASLIPGASGRWEPRDMLRVGASVFALWDPTQDALDELRGSELAAVTSVPEPEEQSAPR
jgi:hypothetical protein